MEEIALKKKRKVADLDYKRLGRNGKNKSPWIKGPNVRNEKNVKTCERFKKDAEISKQKISK